MKKNFALILAFVMTVGCLFGIIPAADDSNAGGGEALATYKPTIAYANVNYSEDLVLMFAVPAPETLPDGATVKLVVWDEPSLAYSYKDTLSDGENAAKAAVVEAEQSKANIGGAEHFVYKYNELSVEKMTDVIYVRAVLVDADNKALAYSSVLDYSVVEYAETAKGSFNDGAPIVSEDVVGLIDSVLNFGALMQTFYGEDQQHAPNGYLANDELHKIWVTPVVAGKTLDKVFGGFFKYKEGGYATVYEPFFDGRSVTVYKDAEGNVITDANDAEYEEALGFQLDAVDGDIELFVEYEAAAIKELNPNSFGADFGFNNIYEKVLNGNSEIYNAIGTKYNSVGNIELSKWGIVNLSGLSGVNGKNFYNGMRTVADPDDPENLFFLITATDKPVFGFGSRAYLDATTYASVGYGDTVEEAVTIEVEIGKPTPDSVVNISSLYLRNRSDGKSEPYFDLFYVEDNVVKLSADKAAICTLPDTGLMRIAVTVLGTGELKVYYSDADGGMVLGLQRDRAAFPDTYTSATQYFTENTLQLAWTFGRGKGTKAAIDAGRVEIDGQTVPVMNADGTYNNVALQLFAEQNYSFLFNYMRVYIGDIYK